MKRKVSSKTKDTPVDTNSSFLLVEEIVKQLRVQPLTIYRYIKNKKLIAYKLGKEYRVKKEDFENFLSKCKTDK